VALVDRKQTNLAAPIYQEEVITRYKKEMRLKQPREGWPYQALFFSESDSSNAAKINYVSIDFSG